MPIYEYQCDGCSEVFEVFQKHTDPPPTEHACGSLKVRRVLSNTSFVLKGTGWYATDYGNRSKPEGHSSHKKEGDGKGKGEKDGSSGDSAKASGDNKSADGRSASSKEGSKSSGDSSKSSGSGGSGSSGGSSSGSERSSSGHKGKGGSGSATA